jgi:Flp pilus assembly pilin Flp
MKKSVEHKNQEAAADGAVLHRSSGASLVEYALLIGLVATIGILAIRSLGQGVSKEFSTSTGIVSGG